MNERSEALRIVSAVLHDMPALALLAAQSFSDTFGHMYRPEALRQHLEKTCSEAFFLSALEQGDAILLAYENKQLAGYVKMGKLGLPIEAPADARELHRFYLLRPFQGKGYGHALMRAVMGLQETQDCKSIYLGVWEHNERAQRLYQAYGFVPVGEYIYRVGEHADREIIMRRDQK